MNEVFGNPLNAFDWKREPKAEALMLKFLQEAEENPFVQELKNALETTCNTGLIEWVDHIRVPKSHKKEVEEAGFKELYTENGSVVYRNPKAQLPDIVLQDHKQIGIIVDSISDFLSVRGLSAPIQGSPFSGYRSCLVSKGVLIVERRGIETLKPVQENPEKYLLAKEKWMTRPRSLDHEEDDLKIAEILAIELARELGRDRAACLVLHCEREYWQAKNKAGQIQKNRQDRLGMGWANHDHHTFRSSRAHFTQLVHIFEILGFHCRERFYAGEEAGWGAQVMENPRAKLVLFLDVDLQPDEVAIDFAHEKLPDQKKLGTIGLWCALHGDSIIRSGMHHLEAQFKFEELKQGLLDHGIKMMDPFSDFPYLKQAFTKGEMWPVDPKRIAHLFAEGKISKEEAEKFASQGALGSHMENLQRREGYKGFNQKNVSLIIRKTDPRHS